MAVSSCFGTGYSVRTESTIMTTLSIHWLNWILPLASPMNTAAEKKRKYHKVTQDNKYMCELATWIIPIAYLALC
mgnify:CR=1 FL=1